jgi:molybdate transport system regulatory protein
LRTDEGRIQQRFTEVFETLGVNLLTHCLDNHPDIIVMDELGFLESEATTFQQRVFSCLDAPVPVWGVIKPLSTPFLDGIRERKDVTVLTITIDNRDRLYNELTEKKKAVSFRTSKGGIEMDLCYRIWLTNDGKAFGKGPYDLLMAVSQYGSLNEAAKKMGMSYSKAWKVINMIEGRLGFALLRRETGGSGGGGSYLTTEAKDFLKKYSQFLAEADQALTDLFQKHFGETSF